MSRTIEEVLGRLTVWELREGAEDSETVASAVSMESELVKIEVSGGNYGK